MRSYEPPWLVPCSGLGRGVKGDGLTGQGGDEERLLGAVQRVEKVEEIAALLRRQRQGTDLGGQAGAADAPALVVELDHLGQRLLRAVVHVGGAPRHVPQG